ncbi:uncharacterized protein N7496_007182 [Penicillium cataractarum]|uniref:Uncharacterized protein n=1 Tax=Penicillium cataractarum TaxID=2100454 RepID=A0A9W9S394_9EURO|nr:uncharacterized protein N7496_007182 [Penicillium cataractarum]KAJ5371090.1 hypothetical protein N7496_007182 [Penicillium cataractarum]
MMDALTGQKHPQDPQNYPQMYGNNAAARPYASEGYQTGQYTRPEGQGHYEPRYEEGHGNYGASNGGFGGHNNGPANESNHGYPTGDGGYGGTVGYGKEYSSHQPGYVGHDASGGYSNQVEHRREYPQGGHNVPGSYDGHGGYRNGHNGPVNYGASHNNRGHGGHEGGHGQHGGTYRGGH